MEKSRRKLAEAQTDTFLPPLLLRERGGSTMRDQRRKRASEAQPCTISSLINKQGGERSSAVSVDATSQPESASPPPSPTRLRLLPSLSLSLSLSLLPSPRSAYRRVFSRREASYSGNSRRSPGERESRAPQSRTGGPEGRSSVTLNPIRSSITISSIIIRYLFSLPSSGRSSILAYVACRFAHPPIFLRFSPFSSPLSPLFFFLRPRARALGLVALGGLVCNSVDSRLGPFCAVNSSPTRAETFSVPCTCTQDRDRGVERRRATNKVSFG